MKLNRYIRYIIGGFTLFALIFCLNDFNKLNISKASVKTIRVGGDARFAPFDFLDENGTYKGFNVDIMNAIAIEMGFNVEFVPMTWEECLKALKDGRVDVLEGTSKTEDKKEVFDFTGTTSNSYQVIFVRSDTTYIQSLGDLMNKRVAIQAADVNEAIVREIPNVGIVRKKDQADALNALMNGEVDAAVGSKNVGLYFLQKYGNADKVKIVGQSLHSTEYGMSVIKGNKDVLNILNDGLERIKENGTYDKIYKKWFGERIYDKNNALRKTVIIAAAVISIILIILGFIILINRKLKAMVDAKTRQLIRVNSILLESEENYRRLFEMSPDAVFVHNREKILFANEAAIILTGAKGIDRLLGMNICEFVPSLCFKEHEDMIDGSNKEKTITIDGEKIRRVDGKVVDVEIRVTPFVDKGKTIMLSIIKDVTDKKLLNEAIEYDKLKTEFFANISHEFRTPLNIILATIQLIEVHRQNGVLEAGKKLDKYLGTMKQNSYRLLRLVSNLIDITKIDTGFYNLQMENLNIIGLIEDITMSVAEYIENKGIELIFDTEVEERVIACDPDKIERIMLNLLSNSIKFTPKGGTITVNIMDKSDSVEIIIKDTGIGIPEDKLEMIFERFRQVDKSITRNHEGSGIGLSLVKSLVEMHGGSVSVKSKLGCETEITVELPAKIIEEDKKERKILNDDRSVERINVEFSDIYS